MFFKYFITALGFHCRHRLTSQRDLINRRSKSLGFCLLRLISGPPQGANQVTSYMTLRNGLFLGFFFWQANMFPPVMCRHICSQFVLSKQVLRLFSALFSITPVDSLLIGLGWHVMFACEASNTMPNHLSTNTSHWNLFVVILFNSVWWIINYKPSIEMYL